MCDLKGRIRIVVEPTRIWRVFTRVFTNSHLRVGHDISFSDPSRRLFGGGLLLLVIGNPLEDEGCWWTLQNRGPHRDQESVAVIRACRLPVYFHQIRGPLKRYGACRCVFRHLIALGILRNYGLIIFCLAAWLSPSLTQSNRV